ncbi:MAG: hypothetical protein V8T48_12660 [Oscillospiraceae bacterium]
MPLLTATDTGVPSVTVIKPAWQSPYFPFAYSTFHQSPDLEISVT